MAERFGARLKYEDELVAEMRQCEEQLELMYLKKKQRKQQKERDEEQRLKEKEKKRARKEEKKRLIKEEIRQLEQEEQRLQEAMRQREREYEEKKKLLLLYLPVTFLLLARLLPSPSPLSYVEISEHQAVSHLALFRLHCSNALFKRTARTALFILHYSQLQCANFTSQTALHKLHGTNCTAQTALLKLLCKNLTALNKVYCTHCTVYTALHVHYCSVQTLLHKLQCTHCTALCCTARTLYCSHYIHLRLSIQYP